MLIGSCLKVNELLGGGLEPGNLDVLESLPLGVFEFQLVDAVTGWPGQEMPLRLNPSGAVPERCQHAVNRGGTLLLFPLQVL